MPLYDITCDGCGYETEIFRSLAQFDDALPDCEHCDHGAMRRVIRAAFVIQDIQPYRAIATDIATGKPPVITSRAQHRDFLKRNGLVELGDSPTLKAKRADTGLDTPQARKERVGAIKTAIEHVKSGRPNHAA